MELCPVFSAADLVGKKWTIVILEEISLGNGAGFNKIFTRMKKISPKQLSKRLKELENEGLIEKRVVKKIPVRTSYVLTKKGEDFYKLVIGMKKWNENYSENINCSKTVCSNCSRY